MTVHAALTCMLQSSSLTCNIEGTSKEDPNEASQKRWGKWKRGYFKSRGKALQNGVRIAPILQVTPKLQGFEN